MKIVINRQSKRMFILMLALMLVLTTFAPGLSEAKSGTKAGTLTAIKGDVFVKKGGGKKEIKAFEGMGVTQGDSVRTGKDSSVKVVLDDNNETLLGASTQILISELVGNNTAIKQSSGGIWNKVKGTMNAGDGYEVETPTSIMGVRGTLFMVQVGGDGRTNLSVLDGIVGMNRPGSGSRGSEQAVSVDEQVSTGPSSTIPTPSPLDIPQFVQGTDVNLLIQIILDELESAQNREQRAAELEQLYANLNLPDQLLGAVEEAHLASLLAHIAEAIMREIDQSARYQEVEQAFRDRGISWEETYQEARNRVQQAERTRAELERMAERERILQERQNQLRQELQDKIDRHRSGQSTPSVPTGPTTPASPGGGGGGTTPTPGTKVTATFDGGYAVASGTFNGIEYTISIPQQSGDGNTISFTLQNPPSGIIPTGVGPNHALDITGLDGREVELMLSIPEGLSHQPQAYHHEGNGRWEPREIIDYNSDGTVTFETKLSAVAVAAKIPTLGLEADAEPINQGQQYSVQLSWGSIEMGGVGYKLYRSSTSNPNAVKEIWSTRNYTDNMYTDTVEAGETYTYTVKAVRHGFESMPSKVSVPALTMGRIAGTVKSYDEWTDTEEPMSLLMVRVWDTEREELIAGGMTDSEGIYSIDVPAGGPYRITVENNNGHMYELYYVDNDDFVAETDFFLQYNGFDDSDLYTFSVAENANISIPDFSIIPYEYVEGLQGAVWHNRATMTWNPYVDSNLNGYLILKNGKYVDYIENVNETTYTFEGLVPETPYEFGIAAWGGDYALAIGSMNTTTAPVPIQQGTVTGAVYGDFAYDRGIYQNHFHNGFPEIPQETSEFEEEFDYHIVLLNSRGEVVKYGSDPITLNAEHVKKPDWYIDDLVFKVPQNTITFTFQNINLLDDYLLLFHLSQPGVDYLHYFSEEFLSNYQEERIQVIEGLIMEKVIPVIRVYDLYELDESNPIMITSQYQYP